MSAVIERIWRQQSKHEMSDGEHVFGSNRLLSTIDVRHAKPDAEIKYLEVFELKEA